MKIPAHILRGIRAGVTTTTLALAVGCSNQAAEPEATAEPEQVAEAADDDADEQDDADEKDEEEAAPKPVEPPTLLGDLSSPPQTSPFLKGSEPTPVKPPSNPVTTPAGVDGPPKIGGTTPLPPKPPIQVQQPLERPPHWAAACGRG